MHADGSGLAMSHGNDFYFLRVCEDSSTSGWSEVWRRPRLHSAGNEGQAGSEPGPHSSKAALHHAVA